MATTNNKRAQLYIYYQAKDGVWIKEETGYITDAIGSWQRLSLTFTLPSDSISDEVHLKLALIDASGTVYFDTLQLEEGSIATEYSQYIEASSTYTDSGNYIKTITDASGNTIEYNLNETKGILDSIVDAKGNTTTYNYDKDNKPTSVITSDNGSINYNYDLLGRLTDTIINNVNPIFKINYEYHKGINGSETTILKTIDNNGKSISYTYDANGNIETITENGKVIKYYYDELNQLKIEDNEVINKTIVYEYDLGGNITKKEEYEYTTGTPTNSTRTYSYVEILILFENSIVLKFLSCLYSLIFSLRDLYIYFRHVHTPFV